MKCLHYIVLWKCRTTSVSRLVSRVCNIPDFGSLLSNICKRRDTYSILEVGCKAFCRLPLNKSPEFMFYGRVLVVRPETWHTVSSEIVDRGWFWDPRLSAASN